MALTLAAALALSAAGGCGSSDEADASERVASATEPLVWSEVRKIGASDGALHDTFGASAAISGDVAIIGARREDSGQDGAAYVFYRTLEGGNGWGQKTKLMSPDADTHFGWPIALWGEVALISAPAASSFRGTVHVLSRHQGGEDQWGEVARLTASDGQSHDAFGARIALWGDVALVGAPNADGGGQERGAAYVYYRNAGGADHWGEARKLVASDGADEDHFGGGVAISGDVALVGSPNRGTVYAFERNAGGADQWGEVQQIVPSEGPSDSGFGIRIAMSGAIALVAGFEGKVYVLERDEGGSGDWVEATKLVPSTGADDDDGFGDSLAISGDTAVVGAPGRRCDIGWGLFDCGAAYVFHRSAGGPGSWGEAQSFMGSETPFPQRLGSSVAVSADSMVVGADAELYEMPGAAYVYGTGTLAGLGQPCSSSAQCWSDYCVDGVCCDRECGGSDPDDCQACSEAAGAADDGTCGRLADGAACGEGVCLEGACTPGGEGGNCAGGETTQSCPVASSGVLLSGRSCACRLARGARLPGPADAAGAAGIFFAWASVARRRRRPGYRG